MLIVADDAHVACGQRERAVHGIARSRQRRVSRPSWRRVRCAGPHQRQSAGRIPQARYHDVGMPDFSGLVANVELSYILLGMTRFTVGVSRDIYFSYEIAEPFYIQPGLTLSVTQQVSGPWDVQARGNWYTLNYQQAAAAGTAPQAGPGRSLRHLGRRRGVQGWQGHPRRVQSRLRPARVCSARQQLRWTSRGHGGHVCSQVRRYAYSVFVIWRLLVAAGAVGRPGASGRRPTRARRIPHRRTGCPHRHRLGFAGPFRQVHG